MESEWKREASAYDGLCFGSPPDPNSRMAGEEDLSVKPRHGNSGTVTPSPATGRYGGTTSPLTVRYGGTPLPLPAVPTGVAADDPRCGGSDPDLPRYETTGGSKHSY